MPGSIKDRVAIAGMGCTKFGERWDASRDDLLVDAAYEAFEDAGIEPKDVQAAWIGTTASGSTGMTLAMTWCWPKASTSSRTPGLVAWVEHSRRRPMYCRQKAQHQAVLPCWPLPISPDMA